jgi:hypothetical protein
MHAACSATGSDEVPGASPACACSYSTVARGRVGIRGQGRLQGGLGCQPSRFG